MKKQPDIKIFLYHSILRWVFCTFVNSHTFSVRNPTFTSAELQMHLLRSCLNTDWNTLHAKWGRAEHHCLFLQLYDILYTSLSTKTQFEPELLFLLPSCNLNFP